MKLQFQDFFSPNPWVIFGLSCGIYALVLFIQQQYILTADVYYNSLSEQLTIGRLNDYLKAQRRWAWLGYAFIPFALSFKALFVSICLSTGAILLDYRVEFKKIFVMVVQALAIFAIGKCIRLVVIQAVEIKTIDDLIHSDIFSLLGWVGKETVPGWLLYPLSVINLFELLFWILLAGGMGILINRSWNRLIGFIAVTYGSGLLIWVLFIVFLQLSFQ